MLSDDFKNFLESPNFNYLEELAFEGSVPAFTATPMHFLSDIGSPYPQVLQNLLHDDIKKFTFSINSAARLINPETAVDRYRCLKVRVC